MPCPFAVRYPSEWSEVPAGAQKTALSQIGSIATNLSSCFHWTKHLGRPMTRARWGRIVNITSVSGIMGNAGQANYSASKAGLMGFTRSTAREVASRNITCNAIAAGVILLSPTPWAKSIQSPPPAATILSP